MGRLNDRARARQEIASAAPLLCGRDWSKVRGFLEAAASQGEVRGALAGAQQGQQAAG